MAIIGPMIPKGHTFFFPACSTDFVSKNRSSIASYIMVGIRGAKLGARAGPAEPPVARIVVKSAKSFEICNAVSGVSPSVVRDNLAQYLVSSTHLEANKIPSTNPAQEREKIDYEIPVEGKMLCMEVWGGGSERKYLWKHGPDGKSSFEIVNSKANPNHFSNVLSFIRAHVVPEGYPNSVAPSYTPYMQWRSLQHFFGGAMGVFTTRSLLHALGVRGGATSSAVAVNWVIKDGAGRIGKMLFARHGKKFDCDLKQLRFAGDILMQLAAAVELATIAAPQFFLPLACTANVAKNVAVVTSTSTRAPIYKAFARQENIGDVTAKGECISNIADLLGTALGIWLSRRSLSLVGAFIALSCGYVFSSYKEVKAVQLPTLNRARFGLAVECFLNTGKVPSLVDANRRERIFIPPWKQEYPLEIGAHVHDAFSSPEELLSIRPLFEKERYFIGYQPKHKRGYIVLRETAKPEDVIRATFHAHVLLYMIRKSNSKKEAYVRSCQMASTLYESFKHEASTQGWVMSESLLNPGDARIRM